MARQVHRSAEISSILVLGRRLALFSCGDFVGLGWFHSFDFESYFKTTDYIPHKAYPVNFWRDMGGCLALVFSYTLLTDYHFLTHRSLSPRYTMILVKYGGEERLLDRYRRVYVPEGIADCLIKKRKVMLDHARIGTYFGWFVTWFTYVVNIKAWTFYHMFINFFYSAFLVFSTIMDTWQGIACFSLNCGYMKQFLREELKQLKSPKPNPPRVLLKIYQKHRQLASIMSYLSNFWMRSVTLFSCLMLSVELFMIFMHITSESHELEGYAVVIFWTPLITAFLVQVSVLGNDIFRLNREIHKILYQKLNRFMELRMLQKYPFKMCMIMESSIEEFDSKMFGFHYVNSAIVSMRIFSKMLHQASLAFMLMYLYRLNL